MKKKAEDIFLDIKDNSELMVDLAYSSLLYNNKDLAEEVYDLEDAVDDMYKKVERESLKELKKGNLSVDDALTLIRLAGAGEMIADAAQEIADVELRDVELHPILKMSILESDEVFSRVKINSSSILCGKKLGEIKLASETGMFIIAIRRGNTWIYGPDKKTSLKSGDVIFARGPSDGEKHLKKLANGKSKEI